MGDDLDEALLNGEEVVVAIKESIDGVLQNQQYSEHKVSQWTSKCIESCMKRLASQNKPYKYVVTCMIAQKNGAGLHAASSCFWDNSVDISKTIKWENKTMYCICTVFGLCL